MVMFRGETRRLSHSVSAVRAQTPEQHVLYVVLQRSAMTSGTGAILTRRAAACPTIGAPVPPAIRPTSGPPVGRTCHRAHLVNPSRHPGGQRRGAGESGS